MADTLDCGSEPMATCPYNPLHFVRRSRLQTHILKCQKQFPHYVICPFNATHRFPESEMKDHFEKCPNKPINMPEPDESTFTDSSDRSTIYPKSYQSSIFRESMVKSSVSPSLGKTSSCLESMESEVIWKPIGMMKPFRKPLRETDPNHECWDD